MAAHIEVQHLDKNYGSKWAIRDVSFEIAPGEIVGFLGPNGAGKSTTLRILCGLLPATSGRVYINHLPLTTQAQRLKQSLGYMPENNPLPENMRVEEFLRFRAQLKRVDGVTKEVHRVMEHCDLKRTAANKMIRTLSKGFRQRVGIADALLGSPQFIILDEPTIGLDPHQILSIRDLLKQLKGETTVIFSSHILPEVEAACSQLLIIHQGELVANGTSKQLREDHFPRSRYQLVLETNDETSLVDALKGTKFPLQCLKQFQKDSLRYFIFETEPHPDSGFESEFTAWMFTHGYRVRQFFKIEPSLEALFLKLTKFSWKEDTLAL